jgi:hypothetical protein
MRKDGVIIADDYIAIAFAHVTVDIDGMFGESHDSNVALKLLPAARWSSR